MKHDEPYTLADRRDDAAYVGELLGPWERIVDCRRLQATIVALGEEKKEHEATKFKLENAIALATGDRKRYDAEIKAHVVQAERFAHALEKISDTETDDDTADYVCLAYCVRTARGALGK